VIHQLPGGSDGQDRPSSNGPQREGYGDMSACHLKYGIPDIALQRLEAGLLNPTDLARRDSIIVLCAADTGEAVEEIEAYRKHAAAFEHARVWVIGVLSDRNVDLPQRTEGEAQIALTVDPANEAWCAFQALLDPAERSSSVKGRFSSAGAVALSARGRLRSRLGDPL
jgi:hypothetical protein